MPRGVVPCREGQLKMCSNKNGLLSRLWIIAASLLEKDCRGESLKDYRSQRINPFFCISLCILNNLASYRFACFFAESFAELCGSRTATDPATTTAKQCFGSFHFIQRQHDVTCVKKLF